MTDKILESEWFTFLIKFVFIPFMAVGIRLSVAFLKDGRKSSGLNIVLSLFIGSALPFILKDVITSNVPKDYQYFAIGFIAINSDKIAEYAINKVKLDLIITSLLNNILTFLKPKE